jgi:transcriptional regulator with XRE-family HTH domain
LTFNLDLQYELGNVTDQEKTEFYSRIGFNIRTAREKREMKQHVLAEMLGLSRASVVNIEKGRQHVTMHTLWQIAALLNTKFSYFTEGLGQQSATKVETQRMKFDGSFTSQSEKDEVRKGIEQFFKTLKTP